MTWGFIPVENISETIYCGDAETSGTIELNFEVIGHVCKGIDNDFNVEFESNELWDPNSEIYNSISLFISSNVSIPASDTCKVSKATIIKHIAFRIPSTHHAGIYVFFID